MAREVRGVILGCPRRVASRRSAPCRRRRPRCRCRPLYSRLLLQLRLHSAAKPCSAPSYLRDSAMCDAIHRRKYENPIMRQTPELLLFVGPPPPSVLLFAAPLHPPFPPPLPPVSRSTRHRGYAYGFIVRFARRAHFHPSASLNRSLPFQQLRTTENQKKRKEKKRKKREKGEKKKVRASVTGSIHLDSRQRIIRRRQGRVARCTTTGDRRWRRCFIINYN